jgi:hypothetical protein
VTDSCLIYISYVFLSCWIAKLCHKSGGLTLGISPRRLGLICGAVSVEFMVGSLATDQWQATCGAELWALGKEIAERLATYERKVLRRLIGGYSSKLVLVLVLVYVCVVLCISVCLFCVVCCSVFIVLVIVHCSCYCALFLSLCSLLLLLFICYPNWGFSVLFLSFKANARV